MSDERNKLKWRIVRAYWSVRYFFGYKPKWGDLSDVIHGIEPADTPFMRSLRK